MYTAFCFPHNIVHSHILRNVRMKLSTFSFPLNATTTTPRIDNSNSKWNGNSFWFHWKTARQIDKLNGSCEHTSKYPDDIDSHLCWAAFYDSMGFFYHFVPAIICLLLCCFGGAIWCCCCCCCCWCVMFGWIFLPFHRSKLSDDIRTSERERRIQKDFIWWHFKCVHKCIFRIARTQSHMSTMYFHIDMIITTAQRLYQRFCMHAHI